MTPEAAKKYLPLIKALAEGKKIECKIGDRWCQASTPTFDSNLEFRIKPEPEIIPYTFEDRNLFKDGWVRIKGSESLYRINKITHIGIGIGASVRHSYTYKTALTHLEFEDGHVFGKLVMSE